MKGHQQLLPPSVKTFQKKKKPLLLLDNIYKLNRLVRVLPLSSALALLAALPNEESSSFPIGSPPIIKFHKTWHSQPSMFNSLLLGRVKLHHATEWRDTYHSQEAKWESISVTASSHPEGAPRILVLSEPWNFRAGSLQLGICLPMQIPS